MIQPSTEHYDVVVVGSGPSGQKAAIQAVKLGKKVLVVERDLKVGGSCVHRGTIPSKTLRETAISLTNFEKRSAGVFELKATQDLQVASLMKRLDQVVEGHVHYMGQQLGREGVEICHGRASFVNEHEFEIIRVDRTRFRVKGDVIVIAVGSRPRDPNNMTVDHHHIVDSDSLLSMLYLPQSLLVLGAGVIACEYATVFASLGVKVTIVDKGERPLAFLDKEVTDRFVKSFEEKGGVYLPGRNVETAKWDGLSTVTVRMEDGEEVSAEKCLFALGRVARLEGLKIEKAGLGTTSRGVIPVNENCQTKVKHIYAVGDVIGPPSLASAAMEQGRQAICHAFDIESSAENYYLPSGIYAIPEISCVGMNQTQVREKFGKAIVGRARFEEVARGQIAGIEDGFLELITGPDGKRLLGAQILGEGASDLIHVAQMAMVADMPIDGFIDNIFNFPTLTEAYRLAAFDIMVQRGDMDQVARRNRGGESVSTRK
ncbi:MAG: Si-specific NAD(P)(+) transhydrogenase [Verrucomicrobiota bacterium]